MINPDNECPRMMAAFRAHVKSMDKPPKEFLDTSNRGGRKYVRKNMPRSAYWLELLECFKYGWQRAEEKLDA